MVEEDRTETINFTVDSALLRELGERLVGKPHIALAELVKNSYDADASRVHIKLFKDRIEIADNGHGMDFEEFRNFWMRIGTPHKQEKRYSRYLKRPMTGSKGIGRLAVQFLAKEINITTVSRKNTDEELESSVDWDKAIEAGDLTKAEAKYSEKVRDQIFPRDSKHGTRIILKRLNQTWSDEEIENLALEIWTLQSPFTSNPNIKKDAQMDFEVELFSQDEELKSKFEERMKAYFDLYYAKINGKLESRSQKELKSIPNKTVLISLEFEDGEKKVEKFVWEDCHIYNLEFEIRVYHLQHRQKFGIKVSDFRDYLLDFGGVHIYDGGFHFPYYGPDTDWLHIEKDHSHRLSKSKLLPDYLHIPRGMNYLPTMTRLFGVVHVDTGQEHSTFTKFMNSEKEDYLKISPTRDRLIPNKAYEDLAKIVRWALDYYAMIEAKRQFKDIEKKRGTEPVTEKYIRVKDVLKQYQKEIPDDIFPKIEHEVTDAIEASEVEYESYARRAALLGSLATAGICALSTEHEMNRQYARLESLVEDIKSIKTADEKINTKLDTLVNELEDWLQTSKGRRALFSHLLDKKSRESIDRYKAKALIRNVLDQIRLFTRGISIHLFDLDEDVRLPRGRFVEWSAIFQNVFINAVNAMLDTDRKILKISHYTDERERGMKIQDTGHGVDLSESEELFEPFERRMKISPERQQLGLGGTGLGLTIVKMISEELDCRVEFTEPDKGFSTAFHIFWRESK